MATDTKRPTLAELQAMNLPRLDWRDLLRADDGNPIEERVTPDEIKAMEEYFRRFLKPGVCVQCGCKQGGGILDGFLGVAKFRWGLTHGEGFCSECRYPARAYHYNVGPLDGRLDVILQYHPDELSEKPTNGTAADG